MRVAAFVSVLSVFALGCGAPEEGTELHQQFLVWNPGTALVSEHTQWHNGRCDTPGARRCMNMGEDFFRFHRNFLSRLRDEFRRQNLNADVTPWVVIPPSMKNPAFGWTNELQTAENNINTMFDPLTGARFASLNRFGAYVESAIHGKLHGIAAAAFSESAIGPVAMSPTSTYFFKIHGWVERQFMRFQQGDFNRDGASDLFVRNTSTGVNQFWLMNKNTTTVSSKVDTTTMTPSSCNWYVGATADVDYDGWVDLIWHSSSCARTVAWLMVGTTRLTSVELTGVGTGWTLIGSGDFNADVRPDLVWRNNTTWAVSVWLMNKTTREGSLEVAMPAAHRPVAIADVTDDGTWDVIVVRSGTNPENFFHAQHMLPNGVKGQLGFLGGVTRSVFATQVAVGRFQAMTTAADLAFVEQPPGPTVSYMFALRGSNPGFPFSPNYTMTTPVALTGGALSIMGPR